MVRWTQGQVQVVQPSKTAIAVWQHLIRQTEHTPGPHQQFFLQYLHEKFREQWPRQYAKTHGKGQKQAKPEANGQMVLGKL